MSAIVRKLAALKAARALRHGALLAHHTATLPGVAASPNSASGIHRLCRYKQRLGPFLLLADSKTTAAKYIRYFSPVLRRLMRTSWPGPVTLIVPAKPGLNDICYNGGQIAIRVDASPQVRVLAKACGGILLSSSLNRKGQVSGKPDFSTRYKLHRHIGYCLSGFPADGKASTLLRVWRNDFTTIRP